jgi:heme a synthase
MSIGITGAVTALGDTLFPASSLRSSLMQDFGSGAPALLHFRLFHPAVALIAGAYAVWVISKTSTRRAGLWPSAMALIIILVAQLGIGLFSVILLTPVWLQILHLFVADAFWMLLVLVSADLILVGARSACTEAAVVTT